MKLNRNASNWSELERNKTNENWDIIEGSYNGVVGKILDEVVGHLIDSAKLNWKEPVDTVEDLPTTAEEGDTRMVKEGVVGVAEVYRFDGERWSKIQEFDATAINELDSRLTTRLAETTNKVGVSYEEFGAVLDGVTDDTLAIQQAHDFANIHGLPVIQRNSKFLLNGEVEVKTSTDLSGSNLITTWVDDSSVPGRRNNSLFKITGKEKMNITSQVQRVDFVKGVNNIPSLSGFDNGDIFIETTDTDIERFIGNDRYQDIYKKEANKIVGEGNLAYPLTKDYSGSIGFKVLYCENESNLVFKSPKLTLKNCKIKSMFYVTRSNVTIKNVELEEVEESKRNDVVPIYTTAEFVKCNNVSLDNVIAERLGRQRGNTEGESTNGYLFLFTISSNIKMSNVENFSGWSGANGNYFRDITVKNCRLKSFNSHVSMYDVYVSDSILYSGSAFHGGGYLIFERTDFIKNGTDNLFALTPRTDYGNEFEGIVKVNDCRFNGFRYIFRLSPLRYDIGRKSILPRVELDNIEIHQPENDPRIYIVSLGEMVDNIKYSLPSFKMSNIFLNEINRVGFVLFESNNISNNKLKGEINVEINNVKYKDMPLFEDGHSSFSSANIWTSHVINNDVSINIDIKDSVASFNLRGTSNIKVNCYDSVVTGINIGGGLKKYITNNGDIIEFFFNTCIFRKLYTNISLVIDGFENEYNQIADIAIVNSRYERSRNKDGTIHSNTVGVGFSEKLITYTRNNIYKKGSLISQGVTNNELLTNYRPNVSRNDYWRDVEYPN